MGVVKPGEGKSVGRAVRARGGATPPLEAGSHREPQPTSHKVALHGATLYSCMNVSLGLPGSETHSSLLPAPHTSWEPGQLAAWQSQLR